MTQAATRGRVIETKPMRNPDVTNRDVMTRRGWWMVVLCFLLPGSAQVVGGNRKLGRIGIAATLLMWVLVAVTIVLWFTARPVLTSLATNWFVLTLAQVLLLAYAVLWIVLAINTLKNVRLVRTGKGARWGIAALCILSTLAASGGAVYAANIAGSTRGAFGDIFTADAPAAPPSDGYYNILLLGADSGEGRDSMRFDSISVVSINADTGQVTITGIPRDMKYVPFSPGPMQDLYPDGHYEHDDLECGWSAAINQLNTEVELCRADENLYPDAVKNSSTPGIEATKDAAEGVLGIKIQYYVFIDMDHFAKLIDALGGVKINVKERLPKGGGPAYDGQPAEEWAIGWIEPGEQVMSGDTAQWYARSRYTTSDWDRMERQRILQQAILAQFTPANVAARFDDIASAGAAVVETDIPGSMVSTFIDLGLKAKELPVQTVELTPDGAGIDPEDPDFGAIQTLVNDTLHPENDTQE